MGVMLFPSFMLGNASTEGSAPLAPLSPFSFSLPLSLLFSSSLPFFLSSSLFSLSSSLFSSLLLLLFHFFFFLRLILPKLLPSLFFFSSFPLLSFSSSFHSVFLLCPFLLPSSAFPSLWSSSIYFHLVFLFFFFLRELFVLNVFQDVIEGTSDCN